MRPAAALVLVLLATACGAPQQTADNKAGGADAGGEIVLRPGGGDRRLYQQGQPYTPGRAGDDRYTCWGSPAQEKECQDVRGPGYHCPLESPVGYWEGEIRCKGTAMTDAEQQQEWEQLQSLSVPNCVCGCTDDYAQAYDALQQRIDHCSRVP